MVRNLKERKLWTSRVLVLHTCSASWALWWDFIFDSLLYFFDHRLSSAVATCPALATPFNGAKSTDNVALGAKVVFTCNLGYRLIGGSHLYCQLDNTWNGTAPLCRGKVVSFRFSSLQLFLCIHYKLREKKNISSRQLSIDPRWPACIDDVFCELCSQHCGFLSNRKYKQHSHIKIEVVIWWRSGSVFDIARELCPLVVRAHAAQYSSRFGHYRKKRTTLA